MNCIYCPFHKAGDEKYTQLGFGYPVQDLSVQNESGVKRCEQTAMKAGFRVSVGGRGF